MARDAAVLTLRYLRTAVPRAAAAWDAGLARGVTRATGTVVAGLPIRTIVVLAAPRAGEAAGRGAEAGGFRRAGVGALRRLLLRRRPPHGHAAEAGNNASD